MRNFKKQCQKIILALYRATLLPCMVSGDHRNSVFQQRKMYTNRHRLRELGEQL